MFRPHCLSLFGYRFLPGGVGEFGKVAKAAWAVSKPSAKAHNPPPSEKNETRVSAILGESVTVSK